MVHEKGSSYTPKARPWSCTPLCGRWQEEHDSGFTAGGKAVGEGSYLLSRGLTSDALSYKGSIKPCNLEDWMVPSVKQALVEQGR